MNTNVNIESLALWIAGIKELAKQDTEDQVFWFVPSMTSKCCIVAGWHKMTADADLSDIFCCSKSQPEYVMSVKVAVNDDQVCPDFDSLDMPIDKFGDVEDTCVPLEWDDVPMLVAEFYMHEWERLNEV